MPEGHTIHRLARDIGRDLAGDKVRTWSPQGRFAESAELVDGRTIERVEAFGKHLFHRFDNGHVLHVHLGLIGKFRRHAAPVPDPIGIVRLRLEGRDAAWDLSGPAICRLITPDDVTAIVAMLGPDPLRRRSDPRRFIDRIRTSSKPIGALLLDQSVVAGVGNVYRAEVLFLQGIDPRTPGNELAQEQAHDLWNELVVQLRDGYKRNRIVTLRSEDRTGPINRLSKADGLYVYHHDTCRRCGGPITPISIANRRIDVCSTCQR